MQLANKSCRDNGGKCVAANKCKSVIGKNLCQGKEVCCRNARKNALNGNGKGKKFSKKPKSENKKNGKVRSNKGRQRKNGRKNGRKNTNIKKNRPRKFRKERQRGRKVQKQRQGNFKKKYLS